MTQIFQSTLLGKDLLTAQTQLFWLEVPTDFTFIPGQFITIQTAENYHRSYSIAFREANKIAILVSLKEDGKFTPKLFVAEIGQIYTIEGPLGNFVLPSTLPDTVCLICTGTGLAPFIPMIPEILKFPEKKVHLIYGNRYETDFVFHAHYLNLAKNNPHFSYWPICSREEKWGRKGYVHSVYTSLFKKGAESAHFMVCGWENMCKEARQNLKEIGFSRRQYTFEQYDG